MSVLCGLNGGEKTLCGVCGRASRRIYDRKLHWARDLSAGDARIYLEIETSYYQKLWIDDGMKKAAYPSA